MTPSRDTAAARRRPGGFSLIEAVLSVVIVGTLMVAALNTVGASRTAQVSAARRSRAVPLANALMAEILQQPYEDPTTPGDTTLGPEADEGATRKDFDDFDDYEDWVESPPQRRDGAEIPWSRGFKRTVRVKWCDPSDLDDDLDTPSGVKRVRVRVFYNSQEVFTLRAIRTKRWVHPTIAQE